MAAETGNLLRQPIACACHQIILAGTPQFLTMRDRVGYAAARRLDDVLTERLGVERRQFAVPVSGPGGRFWQSGSSVSSCGCSRWFAGTIVGAAGV